MDNDLSPRRRNMRPRGMRAPQREPQRLSQRASNWRARRTLEEIEDTGRYFIDPSIIPDDMSYEFKALSCRGEELKEHQVRVMRDGAWDPVPSSRHPELLGKYYDPAKPDAPIIIGGQILMERPRIYTEEAQMELAAKAKSTMREQFESLGLPTGEGPPKMKPQMKMDYSVQVAPEDDAPEAA